MLTRSVLVASLVFVAACSPNADEASEGAGGAGAVGGSNTGGASGSVGGGGSGAGTGGQGGSYVPSPGTLHEHETFEHDGGTRTYHFYEAGGQEEFARPLVLVLHGGSAMIDAFIGKSGGAAPMGRAWLAQADKHGLHVAIPQGLAGSGTAHWNDCRGDCTHCGDEDDSGFLVELVDELSETYNVDPKRIYVAGESNGGFMSLRLAQEHPDVFAAFGPVIALMPADNKCAAATAPASVVFVLGTEDATSVYKGGEAVLAASGTMLSADDSIAYWLSKGECEDTPEVFEVPDVSQDDATTVTRFRHDCPATGKQVMRYRVDGGGHVPPSIAEQVTAFWESLVGKQNHDIETAAELWNFFEANPAQ